MERYIALENFVLASPRGYLVPMLAMAFVVRMLPPRSLAASLLRAVGVFSHELLHFAVGYLTRARPIGMTLIPRREGNLIILGSVEFERLTWANAWATALAPLLALPALYALASWRTTNQVERLTFEDLAWWTLAGPIVLYCWPSRADWRIALISWPILGLGLLFTALYVWTHDLSFLLAWSSVAS
jgi:hypothetical protein